MDAIEQGSIPAQTGQAISEEGGAAMLDPDRLASTGTEKGDRAVQSTQENQSCEVLRLTSEDELDGEWRHRAGQHPRSDRASHLRGRVVRPCSTRTG